MPESTPRVSVVLPTHNRAELLRRSLDSVLAQSYRSLEVLVVENACSDHTAAVLDAYVDPRIRRLPLSHRVNASSARNHALREARGELIAFQDDDDVWLHDKLQHQVQILDAAPVGTVLCLCGHFRLLPGRESACCSKDDFAMLQFDQGLSQTQGIIATPGWLARRSALVQAGGFDEALPARNDWELALRLRNCGPFVFLAEPLFIQDQRLPTSMAHNQVAHGQAVQHIERKHGARWAHCAAIVGAHARAIAKGELAAGNTDAARIWLRRALRAQPLRLRTWGAYAASFLGTGFGMAIIDLYHRAYLRITGQRR